MIALLLCILNGAWFFTWYLLGFPWVAVITGLITLFAQDIWFTRASQEKIANWFEAAQKYQKRNMIIMSVSLVLQIAAMIYMGWLGWGVMLGTFLVSTAIQLRSQLTVLRRLRGCYSTPNPETTPSN